MIGDGAPETHERVRAIFFEVCDLHGPLRESALDRLCGSDPAIRSQVLRLLRRDGSEDDLLADAAVDAGAAFRVDGVDGNECVVERCPVQIGGYRILRQVGAGGMGTVYEAEQQEPRRIVALKTLRWWAPTESLRRRFHREAEVLGRLQHPFIGQIFEARLHGTGDGAALPYFVMEFVHGQPVTTFVQRRGLPVEQRLRLFLRICGAVSYAHDRGVVHRDLKPDNILVDSEGQPKILDFGIAKTTDSDLHLTSQETHAGQFLGTLPYMSPEQVTGDSSKVDERSDVYALGVLLYEMLAARLPLEVCTTPLPEALRIIQQDSHTRLSQVHRAFRGDLDTIVGKALEKSRDRRYQSVSELSEDVRRYCDREPIKARPASAFYQLSKFARRNKTLVGGVCAVILTLLVGVIGTTRYAILAATREKTERWERYRARIDAASSSLDRYDIPEARRHLDEAPPEFRGWEWRYLHRQLEQWDVEIDCGAEVTGGLAFLPSDKDIGSQRIMASLVDEAYSDRIGVWDARSGQLVRSISVADGIASVGRHASGGLPAFLSKRGELIVVKADGVGDVSLQNELWDEAGVPPVAPADVNGLAVSADGRTICVTYRGGLLAWDRFQRRVIWRFDANSFLAMGKSGAPSLSCPTIAADGSRVFALVAGFGHKEVWGWDISTGAARGSAGFQQAGESIAVRSDLRELAIGSSVRDVLVVDLAAMSLRKLLYGHAERVHDVVYSSDGRLLASLSEDGSIRVRDAHDHRLIKVFYLPVRPQASAALSFCRDSARLAAYEGHRIFVFSVAAEGSLELRGHDSFVYHVAFSPDGAMLASSSFADQTVRLWDPVTGAPLAKLPDAGSPRRLAFFDGGATVAGTGRDERIWDTATAALVARDTASDDPKSGIGQAESPTAGRIIDASGRFECAFRADAPGTQPPSDVVEFTTRASDAPPKQLRHGSDVRCAAFSPNGSILAVGSENGEITIWNVADLTQTATLRRHSGMVFAVAFSPDGRRLASGGNDGSLRLWDTATWDQVFEGHDHSSYVHDVTFSPDGSQIATASGDWTVRVWDSRPKSERRTQACIEGEVRRRIRPLVESLLAECGDIKSTATRIRGDASLTSEERRGALRALLALSTDQEDDGVRRAAAQH